jgi:hypothetical protein
MDWSKVHDAPGRRPDPPAPTVVRELWTLHKPPNRTMTATICVTAAGRELRIFHGASSDNLWRSLLSRTGDGPLEAHAEEARTALIAVGWKEGA